MKCLLITLLACLLQLVAAAQQPNEVTLVVTGEGSTKEDATDNALRSAIEQAFGVFVSANTEILNEELVKDEIATVSSGNIRTFQELSCIKEPSGNYMMTLNATVSIGKLVEYTQNHGAVTELAGSVFASNYREQVLRTKNIKTSLTNAIPIAWELAKSMYDFELKTSQPKITGKGTATISVSVIVKSNENTNALGDFLFPLLSSISLSNEDILPRLQEGYSAYGYLLLSSNRKQHMPSLSGQNNLSGDNKMIKRLRYFLDEPIDKQFLQNWRVIA